jgi:hypothetical protein
MRGPGARRWRWTSSSCARRTRWTSRGSGTAKMGIRITPMPKGCTGRPESPGRMGGASAVRVSSRLARRPQRRSRASSAFIRPGASLAANVSRVAALGLLRMSPWANISRVARPPVSGASPSANISGVVSRPRPVLFGHGDAGSTKMARRGVLFGHGDTASSVATRWPVLFGHGDTASSGATRRPVLFGHGDTASSGATRRAFCSATAAAGGSRARCNGSRAA